ncbi:MAG TPA: amidohydrolase family protein [Blastocatellia bacterium]|nr:amidohydrolase family protein [Blastocatellia bacterium]
MNKILGSLAFLLAFSSAGGSGQTTTPSGAKAFVGARVFDGSGKPAIENATLIVRDGRVEAVGPASSVKAPAGAQTINLAGKFIIPGLISTHVHISDVQGLRPPAYTEENTLRQLGVFARYGVTAVLSLGGEKEPAFKARDAQNTPSLDRARIFLSGDVITGRTPQEAREMVARVAAAKPDVIKIRVDDNLGASPKMPPEVYRAIIDEAHQRGLRVTAHIFYLEDAKDLLRSGVDFIAHSVRDKDIDDDFISLMKKRSVPYCPTLTREISTFVYESTPAFFSDPFFLREADREVVAQLKEPQRQEAMRKSATAQRYKEALTVAKRNLKKAIDAGLLVAMGTDAGPFANRFQGYFEHLEMEIMAEAGLTPAQILRSATGDAARAMKVDGIGAIAKGAWADFIVLERDPLKDIRNTRSIASVWIAGNQVKGIESLTGNAK